jgi:class 3 adenylate cyclase/predicted ATPase
VRLWYLRAGMPPSAAVSVDVQCPSCNAANPGASRYCNQCAFSLASVCVGCGFVNRVGAQQCGSCLEKLAIPREPQRSVEAERRQITVFFCDLVSSTTIARGLDAEDFRDLINEYQAICHEVVNEFGGHVAQYLGDGVMVYFGYPLAHEDDPQRATQAAIVLIERIRTLNDRLRLELPLVPQVRIGVHTGIVVIGQVGSGRDRLALGETPHLAARLQQLAEADSVVVSDATRRLIDGYFNLESFGRHALKGFDEPVSVYRALSSTGVQGRLDASGSAVSPLVGRDREERELLEQWKSVRAGASRAALLTGEAGIGKSRQLQALKHGLTGEKQILEGYCSPLHQSTVLRPIAQALETAAGLGSVPAGEQRFRELEAYLTACGLPSEAAALLAPSLFLPVPPGAAGTALTPTVKRQRTLQTFLDWLRALARRAPVLFSVEDLHWADPSTLELLRLYLEAPSAAPILFLLTSRPEAAPNWDSPALVTVSLPRLSRDFSEQVIRRAGGGFSLPNTVMERIIELADGVPLYLEEITKAILESGVLRKGDGRYELIGALPTEVLPTTVHDSLMARLDRLGESRALAQLAAAFGREFSYDVLRDVALMDDAAFNAALRRLVESGLILVSEEHGTRVYRFKHALIQQAAYQSLLKSRRQQYHHRIASVLRDQFPDLAHTQPGLIAQHLARANLPDLALNYFERAGSSSFAAHAYLESISHYRAGLDQLQKLPPGSDREARELALQAGLGLPLLMTKGYASADVESTFDRALVLCADVDPPIRILFGIWGVQLVRGDVAGTERLASRFARMAETTRSPAERLISFAAVGSHLFLRGDFSAAIPPLERAVAAFEPEMIATLPRDYGYDNALHGHFYLMWAQYMAGRIGDGSATRRVAASVIADTGARYLAVIELSFGAAAARDLGDVDEALELSARGVALAAEHQLLFWLALAQIQHGWAVCQHGDAMPGIAEIEQGLGLFRAIGALTPLPYYLCYLAEACLGAGALDRAAATIDEALALVDRGVDRHCLSEALRLKAEILSLQGGEPAAVEELYRSGIEAARAGGAALWEVRTATSYGRLLLSRGDKQAARALLEPACQRIHGCEPPVLKAARALLAEAD